MMTAPPIPFARIGTGLPTLQVESPVPEQRLCSTHLQQQRFAGTVAGKLKARRQAHNTAFVKAADKGALRAALSRLIIIERVDAAELEALCAKKAAERLSDSK